MTDDKTIPVMVTLDSSNLRRVADVMVDEGEHGAAHALYRAATEIENGTYDHRPASGGERVILWGVNRPDGTPMHSAPTTGSAFWKFIAGHHGFFHERGEEFAADAVQEFAEKLTRQGVPAPAAVHRVVRIVITTTSERQLDWPDTPLMQEGLER